MPTFLSGYFCRQICQPLGWRRHNDWISAVIHTDLLNSRSLDPHAQVSFLKVTFSAFPQSPHVMESPDHRRVLTREGDHLLRPTPLSSSGNIVKPDSLQPLTFQHILEPCLHPLLAPPFSGESLRQPPPTPRRLASQESGSPKRLIPCHLSDMPLRFSQDISPTICCPCCTPCAQMVLKNQNG